MTLLRDVIGGKTGEVSYGIYSKFRVLFSGLKNVVQDKKWITIKFVNI